MLDAPLGRFAEQLVPIRVVALLGVVPALLERLARTDGLEDVRLCRGGLLDHETLRRERGTARFPFRVVPPHEALGVVARDERALKAGRLRLARRDEQHVAVA